MILKSRKDGDAASRGRSFSSSCRASYDILRDGVVIGRAVYNEKYPLSRINPDWSGVGAWVTYGLEQTVAAQRLDDLRQALK